MYGPLFSEGCNQPDIKFETSCEHVDWIHLTLGRVSCKYSVLYKWRGIFQMAELQLVF